jgi:hypothetical protein
VTRKWASVPASSGFRAISTQRRPAAVPPLIPHLRGVRSFAEPCYGDGALVRHLETFGLRCVYAGDISHGQDALALDHYGPADAIITKPALQPRADAQAGSRTSRTLRQPGC